MQCTCACIMVIAPMRLEKLRQVDLNLLIIFAVIAEERSVTKACARRLLSQPAVSRALQRARRKNPIFVELKSILAKTSGIRDILHEAVLLRIGLSLRSCTARLHEARRRRRATWI
jgi:hypothetical protein